MSKITAFTKQNLAGVRTDITRALMEVEMKYGIRIVLGAGKFNDDEVTYKFSAQVIDRGGRAPGQTARGDKAMAELKEVAPMLYPKLDITKIVTLRGEKYKIIGHNKRAHQYPFILEAVDGGKRYKFPAAQVLLAAGAV